MDFKVQENVQFVKNSILIKFPILGTIVSKLSFVENDSINTACTDGFNVFYNVNFMNSLQTEEQTFILSHECLHVAFDHLRRKKDKNDNLWNIATDAVINQILYYSGLPMPDGAINMPIAKNLSAEQMYEWLKINRPDLQKDKKIVIDKDNNIFDESKIGNHSKWDDVVNKLVEMGDFNILQGNGNINEQDIIRQNKAKIQEILQNIKAKNGSTLGSGVNELVVTKGTSKSVINWEKELLKETQKDVVMWSYRRANQRNNWCARQETLVRFEKSRVEVILDTSGSVNLNMIKTFIKQVKHIYKNADLKVGCFNSKFYEFKDILNQSDIENLNLNIGGGTSFVACVNGFSKDESVSKVVFTDGEFDKCSWASVPKTAHNIIWVVYGDSKFIAKYGKVIQINKEQIKDF